MTGHEMTLGLASVAHVCYAVALDLTKMQVDTNVSEADISAVAAGQETTFTVDAYPGQVMHGKGRCGLLRCVSGLATTSSVNSTMAVSRRGKS